MIYECHIGMAQEEERVGTYNEFREKILPRIAEAGYNCISDYGYSGASLLWEFRVSCFQLFAPSSRFGTPDELKELIDTAHRMGIAVIMDIVHSHAVKNEVEGLGNLPVILINTSIRAAGVNIRHGIPYALIMVRMK